MVLEMKPRVLCMLSMSICYIPALREFTLEGVVIGASLRGLVLGADTEEADSCFPCEHSKLVAICEPRELSLRTKLDRHFEHGLCSLQN